MTRPGRVRRIRRTLARIALVIVVLGFAAAVLWRAEVAAQLRTVAVLGTTLDAPALTPAIRALTREPVSRDLRIADVPTTVVRPGGDGPWPTVVFITGADPKGRKQATVVRVAEGLARAGFQAVVPDLPGLADARVTLDTLDTGATFVDAVAKLDDTRNGKVSIASVSTGASLAVLIAQQPEADGDVQSITGIAPYADVRRVLRMMTTRTYLRDDGSIERNDPDEYLKESFAGSLARELDEPPRVLLDAIDDIGDDIDDPFASLREVPPSTLDADARALVALLCNEDPTRFDALFDDLPSRMRMVIARLTPLTRAADLDVPVHLATSRHDKYFPVGETEDLAAALPDAHVTVTDALDHAVPSFGFESAGEFAALDAYLVRALHDAASN